jgi:hypothetical protein
MSNDLSPVDHAAIAILKQHRDSHLRDMQREKLHAIYVTGTHNPPAGASEAVLAVEETLRDNCIAAALFHGAEAARFAAAILRAEGGAA